VQYLVAWFLLCSSAVSSSLVPLVF